MNRTEDSISRRFGALSETRAGSGSQQFSAGFSFLGDSINLVDRQGSSLSVGSTPAPLASLGFQASLPVRSWVHPGSARKSSAWLPPDFGRVAEWLLQRLTQKASDTGTTLRRHARSNRVTSTTPLSRSCSIQAERIPENSIAEPQPRHCRVRGVFSRDRFLADCFSSTQATYIGRSFGEGFPSPVRLSWGTGFLISMHAFYNGHAGDLEVS